MSRPGVISWAAPIAAGLVLAIAAGGCAQKKQVQAEQPFGPAGLTVSQIQSEVMSYADTLSDLVAQATDDVIRDLTEPAVRAVATNFKLQTVRGAYMIAAGPNPIVGVLDMTVMVTLTAQSIEIMTSMPELADVRPPKREYVRDAIARAEELVWILAAKVGTEEELQVLRQLIDGWRAEHPDQVYVANIRFDDFASARRTTVAGAKKGGGSLFGLVGLDPLANLDPTTREIEQTRMLADRMFFYLSRLPTMLGWQVEEATWMIAAAPETQQLLRNTDRYADVAERYAAFAEALPEDLNERLTAERTATIDQVQVAIAEERAAFFEELNRENENLDNTLRELRTTVEAGKELARSLHVAIGSADELVSKFVSGEPAPEPVEPAEPVRFSDVQTAIEQTTLATMELNSLVSNLDGLLNSPQADERIAELENVLALAEASGARLLNRTFLLLAGLVVLMFAASIVKVLVQGGRTPAPSPASPAPDEVRPANRV